MKREDRVARLEALLARVRANVAARGDRPRSLLSYRPKPPAEDDEGHAPLPIMVRRAVISLPADESTLEALSQRALALTTTDDLLAGSRARSVEEPGWPASVAPPAPEAHVVAAHEPVEEEPAPSRLERAVRDAASEQLSPLLFEAANELRDHERRPLSEPPPPALAPLAPVLRAEIYADHAPPAAEEAFTVEPPRVADRYAELDSAFRERPMEPALVAREPERGTWMLWAGAAAGAALVLGGAWLLRGPPPGSEPSRPDTAITTPASAVPVATGALGDPPVRPATSEPNAQPSALTSTPSAAHEPAFDPPDTSGLAVDRGLLWVEANVLREVYVTGDAAGQTGKWLRVPCGLRNVRTAQPGPPPAGSSFPIWTSEGHSVLIPCRSYTKVTMPTDP